MGKFRKYTDGISFYVSPGMRQELEKLSNSKQEPVSEVLREIIETYLSFKEAQKSTSKILETNKSKKSE